MQTNIGSVNENLPSSLSIVKSDRVDAVVYPRKDFTIHRSYCEIVQKNKPQCNSIVGGIFLLMFSGLHTAWGLWRVEVREPWASFANLNIIIFIKMSWYMFAVLGGFVGAVLVAKTRKQLIYYTGGIISAMSSIVFIIWYNSYIAIIVGRCLAGLTHGIVYNAIITHAGENVVKEIRGTVLSTVNSMMYSGVFISATLISAVNYGDVGAFNSDRIVGMFGLAFSMLAIVCTCFLTYESIPYLLRRGKESDAVVNLMKLRNESAVNRKITEDLDEMRLMVAQDKLENQNIFSNGNGSAMAKIIGLQTMSTLTNNFLLNMIMMGLTMRIFDPDNYHFAAVVLTGTRCGGSLIPIFTTDFFSRKAHLTASTIACGILLLVLAIIVVSAGECEMNTSSWVTVALCIAFQLSASIGIDPIGYILISEAFSTSKKAWSIAYVTAIEYILQMVMIGFFYIDGITYLTTVAVLFTTAGLMFALMLVLQLSIPETLNLNIRETRDLFRK